MKRAITILLTLTMLFALVACGTPAATPAETPVEAPVEAPAEEAKKLTFGYITPGPDTWYLRDVEGFQAAAKLLGVEVVVLNSDYDVSAEMANIENLVSQGVDGISVFSFNESGAITAAEKGAEANIPVVATDSVGSVFNATVDVAGAVDFDWSGMGVAYANWMAETHPGKDFVIITGNFESVPCQKINAAMEETSEQLGKNKLIKIEDGDYTPAKAADIAEDLVNSGLDFGIIFVMDEDMAAAVYTRLSDMDVADDYVLIAENGSEVGLEMINAGTLAYTISSSPGWEGFIACLALYDAVVNESFEPGQNYYLPIVEITPETDTSDPTKVVPWTVDVDSYITLTQDYFPNLYAYLE